MDLSLLRASAEAPNRPALIAGPVTLTYRDLREHVARRAARVPSGSPLAIVGTNEVDTALLWHTLVARAIPLLILHPRLSSAERDALLLRTGARPAWQVAREVPPAAPVELETLADDSRPLAIVPTSGTTGPARLAVLSRRALLASALGSAQNLGWQPDDRWLLALPLAHVGGMAILARCLSGRQTAVLIPPGDTRGIVDRLLDDRITLLSLVPAQLARLLERWPLPGPPRRLRAVLLGGDWVPPELLERASSWPLLTTYGLTETCSQVTCQPYGTRPGREQGAGHPLAGVELRTVEGRIEVRGPQLFSGYWAEAPRDPDAWLATGDLGRIDPAGRLHVLGRASDLIVTGGEKVNPAEVEAVLGRVPGITAACVFGVQDPTWGELVAAALVTNGSAPDEPTLDARLNADLASFKHPRRLAFLPALAYGPGGKLDRARSAELARPLLRLRSRPA